MALDGITIAGITAELQRELIGARISKIAQPEADELLLTIKGPNGQKRLLLSANASLPLMYLTNQNKQSPMTAPNFCMLLRKHIANGRIVSIRQPALERVVEFEIEHLDELGDIRSKKLIVELMGKHSNLIFTDDSNCILDSIKHISAQVSSVREVLPGRSYFLPMQEGKKLPLQETKEGFIQTVFSKPQPLAKAMYQSYVGLSPLFSQELCYRAGLDGDAPVQAVPLIAQEALANKFYDAMEAVKTGAFSPHIYWKEEEPVEFCALPLFMYSDHRAQSCDSVSSMLEQFYAQKNNFTRMRQKTADLRHVVVTHLERNRKKYALQKKQLQDTEKREKYKVYGELIHAFGYNIPSQAKSFEAQNYYTGQMMQVPLDPTLTPMENAKKYFDKYGKLKRTYEALTDLIEETHADIMHLDSILTALDLAGNEADLSPIKEELIQHGYIKKRSGKKQAKPRKSQPYHYKSSDGFDIYVGKNNFQNDELTFRFAQGNDWWFHAKQMPGSHVIVKTKTGDMPDATFEEAARLAAYYSQGQNSEKVEIDYLQKKNVKKPNHAKPGFVVYYTNYSMVSTPKIDGITCIE